MRTKGRQCWPPVSSLRSGEGPGALVATFSFVHVAWHIRVPLFGWDEQLGAWMRFLWLCFLLLLLFLKTVPAPEECGAPANNSQIIPPTPYLCSVLLPSPPPWNFGDRKLQDNICIVLVGSRFNMEKNKAVLGQKAGGLLSVPIVLMCTSE